MFEVSILDYLVIIIYILEKTAMISGKKNDELEVLAKILEKVGN